jgi:uncharacterized protein YkwD
MLKKLVVLMFAILLLPGSVALAAGSYLDSSASGKSTVQMANELVAMVNDLRQANGLSPLNPHPILMQLAQAQAEYMAATGQITHYSADGKRPFQRALAAGYPVAGDLSLGGFYSENIQSGPIMTAEEVVKMWLGDDLHANTMLSEYRSDIGAGVALAGDSAYYVLDTALASSHPVQYTPPPDEGSASEGSYVVAPAATCTPQVDGTILHTVRTGETLWGIAAVYNTTVDLVAQLNHINPNRFIRPGEQFVIRPAHTSTPPIFPAYSPRNTSTPGAPLAPARLAPTADKPASFQPFGSLTTPLGYLALLAAVILGVVMLVQYFKGSR